MHSGNCLLLLKAAGSFGLRPQDDIVWRVILNAVKNPIHSGDCCILLKAMGSFGLCPQDDNEKSGYSKHQEF